MAIGSTKVRWKSFSATKIHQREKLWKDKSIGLVDTNKVKNVSKTEYLFKKLVNLLKINRLRFPLSEITVSGNGYRGIALYRLIHIEQSG